MLAGSVAKIFAAKLFCTAVYCATTSLAVLTGLFERDCKTEYAVFPKPRCYVQERAQIAVWLSHSLATHLLLIVPSSVVEALSAWTWTAISSDTAWCLASQPRCDSTTSCGGRIDSLHECEEAAQRLLNGTATQFQLSSGKATLLRVDADLAPRGCFFVEQEIRKSNLVCFANGP